MRDIRRRDADCVLVPKVPPEPTRIAVTRLSHYNPQIPPLEWQLRTSKVVPLLLST
jgi:hypothetical protein